MGEEWRPVVGFEGLYEVSSQGKIRSLDRRVPTKKEGVTALRKGRVLNPWLVEGYPRVALRHPNSPKHKHLHVHRILAQAFIPNPDNLPIVRHLNDVKTDNRLDNLAWGTVTDNEIDKVRNGNNLNARKTHCIRGHEFTPENTRHVRDGGRQCRLCDEIRRAKNNRKSKERRERGVED